MNDTIFEDFEDKTYAYALNDDPIIVIFKYLPDSVSSLFESEYNITDQCGEHEVICEV